MRSLKKNGVDGHWSRRVLPGTRTRAEQHVRAMAPRASRKRRILRVLCFLLAAGENVNILFPCTIVDLAQL